MSAVLAAAPNAAALADQPANWFAAYAAAAVDADRDQAGAEVLLRFLVRHAEQKGAGNPHPLADGTLPVLARAAAACRFLADFSKFGGGPGKDSLRPDLARWLLRDERRLAQFNELITNEDDWPGVRTVLETLYDHDPAGRDAFFELILAMAVVWDQPAAELHHQATPLPFKPDLARRYDYFKSLYARNRAKVPYRYLDPSELIFVVDTPVPVGELEWAQENCRWSLANWASAYTGIRYDEGRIAGRAWSWPYGPYSLESIREHGGICVDQAFFATIAARANGIPAMMFTGEGRRGGHAWFGYLKGENHWEMNIGRYTFDKFATGRTVNPQTRQVMSSHEIEFRCSRVFTRPEYASAAACCDVAMVFLRAGRDDIAYDLAGDARRLVRITPAAWAIQEAVLTARGDVAGRLALCREKKSVFREYPDLLADAQVEEAELLRKAGRSEEAQSVLAQASRRLKNGTRTDLAMVVAVEEANTLLARGDADGARKRLEAALREARKEGLKTVPLVDAYLQLTKATRQQRDGLNFLDDYLDGMYQQVRSQPGVAPDQAKVFLEQLLTACENAGDDSRAKAVRKRLGKAR